MSPTHEFRTEHDLLGEKQVLAAAYYGVQTTRAMENFHISGVPISQCPDLIPGLAAIKLAAARANYECGQFDKAILDGIDGACRELMEGKRAFPFLRTLVGLRLQHGAKEQGVPVLTIPIGG